MGTAPQMQRRDRHYGSQKRSTLNPTPSVSRTRYHHTTTDNTSLTYVRRHTRTLANHNDESLQTH